MMDLFPYEVTNDICSYLPIEDLLRLRAVNSILSPIVTRFIQCRSKKVTKLKLTFFDDNVEVEVVRFRSDFNGPILGLFSEGIYSCTHIGDMRETKAMFSLEDLWSKLYFAIRYTHIEEINIRHLPMTETMITQLEHALHHSTTNEFRIDITQYDDINIGRALINIMKRVYTKDEKYERLAYAFISFEGTGFPLAADFLIDLSQSVISFELERVPKDDSWRSIINPHHILRILRSKCELISIEYPIDGITRSDIDLYIQICKERMNELNFLRRFYVKRRRISEDEIYSDDFIDIQGFSYYINYSQNMVFLENETQR